MTIDQLAELDDVKSALGRELSDKEESRAEYVLDLASELFRREAGQHFTPGESTVRVKVNDGRAYLTQRPVVEVAEVVDDAGKAVEFTVQDQWVITGLGSASMVTITYTHGGAVPALVRLAVAGVVQKVLLVPDEARAGQTQFSKTQGPFSRNGSYAGWAVGGQVTLSPEDKSLARSYRVSTPKVWVMRP